MYTKRFATLMSCAALAVPSLLYTAPATTAGTLTLISTTAIVSGCAANRREVRQETRTEGRVEERQQERRD